MNIHIGNKRVWDSSLASLAVGLALIHAGPAAAQETGQEDAALPGAGVAAEPEDADGDDSTIVVTGTNISGVKSVGSETVVMRREDVLATGKTTVADVIRTLPQVQNAGGTFNSTNNPQRGEAINLRGIGQGATLTLVDGHRVTPTGTASAFTDANQVPISAIERIEVIADGASAIYGSDAIAGVINYVIRKDFSGIELGGRYTIGDYGNDEWALDGTVGTSWDIGAGIGNIIVTYEHSHRSAYLRGLNPRLRQDQRPYGGDDARIQQGGTTANGASAVAGPGGSLFVPTVGNVVNPNFPQGGAYTYYVLPDNPAGAPLTYADLQEVSAGACGTSTCASYPNVADSSDFTDYMGEQTRDQVAVFLNQTIGSIEFYDEFFYTNDQQKTRSGTNGYVQGNAIVYVSPSSPFYISGIPNTVRNAGFFGPVPQPLAVQMNLLSRLPDDYAFINDTPNESINNTFGARMGLFSDWRAEAYYTYGQSESCGICYIGNYVSFETDPAFVDLANDPLFSAPLLNAMRQSPIQNAVDAGLINPFSSAPFTQAEQDAIFSSNYQYAQNYSHDIVAKVDGSLFDLPGGTLKGAFGGEYYAGIQKLQNGASRPGHPASDVVPDADARTVRKQYAAFGELYFPLVSPDMNVPAMEELLINAALRYDHYSDFGKTTNGKISATWGVTPDLTLRGSWGTSFRAPGLPELNAGVFSVGFGISSTQPAGVTGYCDPTPGPTCNFNTLYVIGSNPNLKPEKGKNWQVGADFQPGSIPGLRLSATYYNLTYENKLGGSGIPFLGAFASPEVIEQFRSLLIPIANPVGCTNGDPSTYDPALVEFTNFLYVANFGFNPRDYCGIEAVVDSRSVSVGEAFQDGLDLSVDYVTDTDVGTFRLSANASHIFTNEQRINATDPLVDVLDTIGNPVSWRGRASVGYSKGAFSATLFGNYIGSYTNNRPISIMGVPQPNQEISAWTTFDLNLSISFDDDDSFILDGTRLGVTVNNLFDNDPPIVLTGSGSSIDTTMHNPFGRYIQLQASKSF